MAHIAVVASGGAHKFNIVRMLRAKEPMKMHDIGALHHLPPINAMWRERLQSTTSTVNGNGRILSTSEVVAIEDSVLRALKVGDVVEVRYDVCNVYLGNVGKRVMTSYGVRRNGNDADVRKYMHHAVKYIPPMLPVPVHRSSTTSH